MPNFLQKNFPSMKKNLIKDYTNFQKKVSGSAIGEDEMKKLMNQFATEKLKEISGAAISEKELSILKSIIGK